MVENHVSVPKAGYTAIERGIQDGIRRLEPVVQYGQCYFFYYQQ